ncbi:YHS domain-containing protein [Paracoccus liaowanqingii]|uniref:YHS domain-containing protein n=1 Tax=Paracoccus liaowanqingii TaxID=2560053 RepID=A0A4Z1CRV6_9RHOB|nr:YHS domain-containing (seleno)protein [Paracoccus liaowanqingii]TGN68053.1 YHS domain-containing protein [Paracoccus liaowanqingii]
MRPLCFALLLTLTPALPAAAQDWAVGGFDPVGYAASGRALPGRSDIATMWKGQVWHFASEENRARFEADPRAYAPALDGMCPISVIEGRPQPGDPRHFAVVAGRLYLLRSNAAERQLQQDPRGITEQARQMYR